LKKTTVPIQGMTCKSCEILLEEGIKEIEGVQKVKASSRVSSVVVHTNDEPDIERIEKAVKKVGFELGKFEPNINCKNRHDYNELGIAVLIIFALYLFVKTLGFANFSFLDVQNPSGFFIVMAIGIAAGFSTCMALAGGLVLGV